MLKLTVSEIYLKFSLKKLIKIKDNQLITKVGKNILNLPKPDKKKTRCFFTKRSEKAFVPFRAIKMNTQTLN